MTHAAILALLAVALTFAWRGTTASPIDPTECDRLAADINDIERVSAGVTDADLLPALAITACAAAVEKGPENRRYWFQYGRALLAGYRQDDAVHAFQRAAGHAGATFYLAKIRMAEYWAVVDTDAAKARTIRDEVGASLRQARHYPPATELANRLVVQPADFRLATLVDVLLSEDYARANRARMWVAAWAEGLHGAISMQFHPEPDNHCPAVVSNPVITRALEGAFLGDPWTLWGRAGTELGRHAARVPFAFKDPIWLGDPERWRGYLKSIGEHDGLLLSQRYGCASPATYDLYQKVVRFSARPLNLAAYAKDIVTLDSIRDLFPELMPVIDGPGAANIASAETPGS